jgi:nucleoside-diphosphate-sugar epimerase
MSNETRTVMVTGASGFLGEHVCRVLAERGHVVRGLSRSRSGVLSELGVEHVRGDVLSGPELAPVTITFLVSLLMSGLRL